MSFMKKKIILSVSILIVIIILIIIGYFVTQKVNAIMTNLITKRSTEFKEETTENGTIFKKEFGSYELPKNWVESKEHSTKNKFFYVLKDHEQDELPNNISINSGTNKYPKKEHEKFRIAILNQLSLQTKNKNGININANGFTTDTGEIVYTFIIKESDVTTTQYYMVGNYEYILIQETIFEDSEETDVAAKHIVNSFKWKENRKGDNHAKNIKSYEKSN